MKLINTKRSLQFDISMQLLIVFSVIASIILKINEDWSFMLFYFGLGSWQLISFFAHLKRRLSNVKFIKAYARGILGALILGLIALSIFYLFEDGIIILFGYLVLMLIAGVVLAIMYITLTLEDLGNVSTKIKES